MIRIIRQVFAVSILFLSVPVWAAANTIYVRLNADPFAAPHYLFSLAEDGEPVELTLVRGDSYEFIRTDSGHPFNIGDQWQSTIEALAPVSTSTQDLVDGIGSIIAGESLSIDIPIDFGPEAISYYCSVHASMIAELSVADPVNTLLVSNILELRSALATVAGNGQDDVIVLSDGLYSLSDGLGGPLQVTENEPFKLTLRALNTHQAVLDGAGAFRILEVISTAESSLEIDGLIFQNGYSEEGAGALEFDVKQTQVKRAVFLNNDGGAIAVYGDYSRGETILIENSRFIGTTSGPAISHTGYYSPLEVVSSYFEGNAGAIEARVYYSDAVIQNSIFVNNTGESHLNAVVLNGGAQERKVILNSLFYEWDQGTDGDVKVAVRFGSTTRNKIYNSVFLKDANINAAEIFEIHNSYVDRTRISGSAFEKNLIFDDVNLAFEDEGAFNFSPLDTSDLIDNGTLKDLVLSDTDFLGRARIIGDFVDIGPYESLSPTGGNGGSVVTPIDGPITVTSLAELRAALNAVVANGQDDSIFLADGTYNIVEDGLGAIEYFDNESSKITLKAVNAGQAILDGGGLGRVMDINSTSATSLVLDGVVIQNGWSDSGAAGLQLNVQDTLIINTLFRENVGGAVYAYGDYGRGEVVRIENSRFLRNTGSPAVRHEGSYSPLFVISSYFESNDGALHARVNYSDAFVQNSIFINNTSESQSDGLVLTGGAQEQKVIQNSLFFELADPSSESVKNAVHFLGTTKNRIYNSVFLDAAGIVSASEIFELYYSYISLDKITGNAFKQGVVFSGVDASFVDAAAFDFTLQDSSGLIDMGYGQEIGLPAVDYLGNARLAGDFVDIGPFESLNPTGGAREVDPGPIDGAMSVSTLAQLRQAFNLAAANGQDDTIILADGVYDLASDGEGTLEFFDNEPFKITLRAMNVEQAILDGGGVHRVLDVNALTATTLSIDGLVIQNGASANGAAGLQLNVQEAQITNTLFQDNQGSAIAAYGDYGRNEVIGVEASRFLNNSLSPAISHSGYYSPLTVNRSYFEGNSGALHAHVNYSSAIVESSLFVNNTNEEQDTSVSMRGGDRAVYNSLFFEMDADSQQSPKKALRISGDTKNEVYNSVFLNDAGIYASGESFEIHHSYADPTKAFLPDGSVQVGLIFDGFYLGFRDALAIDFVPELDSDLIDSGSSMDLGLSPLDFSGNVRISGIAVDIGPFETIDSDSDGIPDALDPDDDNDGFVDEVDAFPQDSTEWADCDGDGIGDNLDLDDDNDGVVDSEDFYACNAAYSSDTDRDGLPDAWEVLNGLEPSDPRDAYFDPDQDGYLNWEEYFLSQNPNESNGLAQILFTDRPATLLPEGAGRFTVRYNTTDTNPNLSGLGIRVHYDSRYVASVTLSNVLEDSLISISSSEEDVNDFDGDIETDRYIIVSWANIQGPNWPGTIPIDLFDINIMALEGISCLAYYPIRFSVTSAATGYNVSAPSVYNPVIQATLDIDGDGEAAALTDGLLIIRHLFGFSGETLINGSVSAEGTYQTSEAIANRIEGFRSAFDVDADGNTAALTDGLLIIRRLFGFSGTTLVAGSVSAEGARTDAAAIAEYIDALAAGLKGSGCSALN